MAMGTVSGRGDVRNKILRVIFVSLLLDLVRDVSALSLWLTQYWLAALDFLHLYTAAIPPASRILQGSRRVKTLTVGLDKDITKSQHIQTLVFASYKWSLRRSIAGWRCWLLVLPTSSHRVSSYWDAVGQIWASYYSPLVHGG